MALIINNESNNYIYEKIHALMFIVHILPRCRVVLTNFLAKHLIRKWYQFPNSTG